MEYNLKSSFALIGKVQEVEKRRVLVQMCMQTDLSFILKSQYCGGYLKLP